MILLAVAVALPIDQVSFDLGHLLHACAAVLRSRYSLSAAPWSAVLAAAAAVAAVLLGRALLLRSVALVQARRRQRALIDVLALELADDGMRVLDHDAALAYCIPGRGGRIVLTSAAVSTLAPDQLAAVIAHERAHLRGRHDVVLFASEVARAAFPWVRFFGVAKEQTAGLVEMLADDQAARQAGPLSLASALVGLGSSAAPGGSLAATGQMTTERVLRLVRDPYGAGAWRHAIVLIVSFALLGAPWVIAVAPAWAARGGLLPVPQTLTRTLAEVAALAARAGVDGAVAARERQPAAAWLLWLVGVDAGRRPVCRGEHYRPGSPGR